MYTVVLAYELKNTNFKINAVCPGFTKTDFNGNRGPETVNDAGKPAGNDNTSPPFPGNTIGFFNNISAIGTRFKPASTMGPQSQKNRAPNGIEQRTILFQF